MAELDRPHPPGNYPAVVVGSGPGGLQMSYSLRRQGIDHALLSADDAPGGMFRRFPIFQRLISWSKPHAPVERSSEQYQWYDWNSLLADEAENRSLTPLFMDGASYFPARDEMEAQLVSYAERSAIACRFVFIF